nr:hypothetical protein [Tanacetum cinerariifolium]
MFDYIKGDWGIRVDDVIKIRRFVSDSGVIEGCVYFEVVLVLHVLRESVLDGCYTSYNSIRVKDPYSKDLTSGIRARFLRSLPSEWRTHTLIWRNKTDLEEQSLDYLFNNLKIYEAEFKSSSSAGTTTQNIAFVSFSNTESTTEPDSAAASVSAVSTKIPVSPLLNV